MSATRSAFTSGIVALMPLIYRAASPNTAETAPEIRSTVIPGIIIFANRSIPPKECRFSDFVGSAMRCPSFERIILFPVIVTSFNWFDCGCRKKFLMVGLVKI